MTALAPPLVLHVVYRFDVGGLENGVVNLINHMSPARYRHAVLAMDEVVPTFASRIRREGVELHALNKPPGHGFAQYPRIAQLCRQLRPTVVHTRNLAALEAQVPAWIAGVPVRVHGEHGRDVGDLDGSSRRYQWIRRAYRPFVQHFVALSRDLQGYLVDRIKVPVRQVSQIYNGVDAERFCPPKQGRRSIEGCPFGADHWLIGSVGRMQTVKDPLLLARAFLLALERHPLLRSRLRLVMVGDGALRQAVQSLLDAAGAKDLAWLPGERSDIPEMLQGLDAFALPSLAEGISNTILEAMATGLPVVATQVGGNGDLVEQQVTGELVPPSDADAMAAALLRLAEDPARSARMGQAGRRSVESRFSLSAMVGAYADLYDRLQIASGRSDRRPSKT